MTPGVTALHGTRPLLNRWVLGAWLGALPKNIIFENITQECLFQARKLIQTFGIGGRFCLNEKPLNLRTRNRAIEKKLIPKDSRKTV
jgi:hypothetical protein